MRVKSESAYNDRNRRMSSANTATNEKRVGASEEAKLYIMRHGYGVKSGGLFYMLVV
jgi:hypothetical protein